MKIERNPQPENGCYLATLVHLEKVQGKHLEWLSWSFFIPRYGAKAGGITTVSESTQAEPYQWAKALNPEIAKKESWGSEDVLGEWCTVVVETHQDSRGRKSILVNGVKPSEAYFSAREG